MNVSQICIYKITNPIGQVYVGQSINVEKRFKQYKNLDCKNQSKLYSSFLEYGLDKHRFDVLEMCEIEMLNTLERKYQEIYNVTSKNGLNCKLQGHNGKSGRLSSETKIKISESNKGKVVSKETRLKLSLINIGNVVSAETRKKISKGHKGKTFSKETREKIGQSHKGMKHSDKSKSKMRKAKLGKNLSDVHKNKISESNKGRIFSNETKEKMSLRITEAKANTLNIYLNIETGVYCFGLKEVSFHTNKSMSYLSNLNVKGKLGKFNFIQV